MFETDLAGNLYKIWNRMSSGTYFPPPVRAVAIPKKTGGERILGVPTVSDRIAQMVVKQMIEPELEPIFLPDSYGYRPGKSALDAVGVTRQRCWSRFRPRRRLRCRRKQGPIQFLENNPIQSSLWVRFMCPKTRRNWLRLPIVRFHPGSSCPQQPP